MVAFRSGGIPEVVRDGETGFLVDGFTGAALAARIRDAMAAGPERLAEMGRHARAAWRERFTLEGYQRRVLTIVESACKWNAARASR